MSRDILLTLIDRDPNNARQTFDETGIAELAQSIAASGLAVPILVRPSGDRYTIVHGERRYRAVQSLGWATIPAEVRELDSESASWLALVENVQRSDLSPIEEAQAYQAKLATGITQTELGQRIGKTQSYIATKLRFLRLPSFVQAGIQLGKISEGQAKQLLRLGCPEVQTLCACAMVKEQWTVTQVRDRVDMLLREIGDSWNRYSEAWLFIERLRTDSDDSPLIRQYGRLAPTGWIAPKDLTQQDWLFAVTLTGLIFKVYSILLPDEYPMSRDILA